MLTKQIQLFLLFIINGIIIGILFDIFRVLRKSFKTNNFVTYIQDFLFWTLTGILILYTAFIFNDGEIRLFMFLGILLGLIFYILSLSKYFVKINVLIIKFFKKLFYKIIQVIFLPFKYLYLKFKKIFIKPISFIIINIRKNSTNLCQKTLKILKNINTSKKNVKN